MNKYRFQTALLILVTVIVFILYGLFHKSNNDQAPLPPSGESQPQQPNKMVQDIHQIPSQLASEPQAPQAPINSDAEVSQAVREYVRKSIADPGYDWKQPINFYGKVVDDKGELVPAASVDYTWSTILSETGTSANHTRSDALGKFSIHETGKRLYMDISKEGYYSAGDARNATFEYANPGDGMFTPDANNPVVFHLRKKGKTESLVVLKRDYRIPKDGTPVDIDLSTGKKVTSEQGSIRIECRTSSERNRNNGNRYDWKCILSVPGGGLTDSTNEFDFIAPTIGYRSTDEINMPQTLADSWSSDVAKAYFVKLGNGNYAYLKFRMIAGGDHFCVIESHLNPNGSPNLEFDPSKSIQAEQ